MHFALTAVGTTPWLTSLQRMARWFYACTAVWLLASCGLAPAQHPASGFKALDPSVSQTSALGQAVAQLRAHAQAPDAASGIYVLEHPQAAFAARAWLARAAQHTLDVQYYIWRNDKTGRLLLHELLLAADRGVQVRLLLDDGGTAGMDRYLATLAQHPHVEVRLFNPFVQRGWAKPLGYVLEFSRTQRRMHNKSFSADAQASIVGGRNVGNEYFGATDGVLFADLDVLAVGPIVPDIEADFERYWNDPAAYPIAQIADADSDYSVNTLRAEGAILAQSPASQDYQAAVRSTALVQQLLQSQLPLDWAETRLISDPPEKIRNDAAPQLLIGEQLREALGTPTERLDLVSPYFVPTQSGVDAFTQLQQQGVQVRILTNGLEATDVAVVHAGYAPYRVPLLQAGVQLWEMQKQAPPVSPPQPAPASATQEAAPDLATRLAGSLGSSGTSLHAKTFAVDGQRAFVGSFNFDPRSMHLNTEMGLLIASPALAQQIHRTFDQGLADRTYRLSLSQDGDLRWHSDGPQLTPVLTTEPHSRWWQRWGLWLLGKLPIEWLL